MHTGEVQFRYFGETLRCRTLFRTGGQLQGEIKAYERSAENFAGTHVAALACIMLDREINHTK